MAHARAMPLDADEEKNCMVRANLTLPRQNFYMQYLQLSPFDLIEPFYFVS